MGLLDGAVPIGILTFLHLDHHHPSHNFESSSETTSAPISHANTPVHRLVRHQQRLLYTTIQNFHTAFPLSPPFQGYSPIFER